MGANCADYLRLNLICHLWTYLIFNLLKIERYNRPKFLTSNKHLCIKNQFYQVLDRLLWTYQPHNKRSISEITIYIYVNFLSKNTHFKFCVIFCASHIRLFRFLKRALCKRTTRYYCEYLFRPESPSFPFYAFVKSRFYANKPEAISKLSSEIQRVICEISHIQNFMKRVMAMGVIWRIFYSIPNWNMSSSQSIKNHNSYNQCVFLFYNEKVHSYWDTF